MIGATSLLPGADGLLVDSGNAGSAQTTYTKYLQPQVSCGWGNLSSSLAPQSMGNIGTRGSLAPHNHTIACIANISECFQMFSDTISEQPEETMDKSAKHRAACVHLSRLTHCGRIKGYLLHVARLTWLWIRKVTEYTPAQGVNNSTATSPFLSFLCTLYNYSSQLLWLISCVLIYQIHLCIIVDEPNFLHLLQHCTQYL